MNIQELSEYDKRIKKVVSEVLKIEKEYKHIENISDSLKKEICGKIIREIEREVK